MESCFLFPGYSQHLLFLKKMPTIFLTFLVIIPFPVLVRCKTKQQRNINNKINKPKKNISLDAFELYGVLFEEVSWFGLLLLVGQQLRSPACIQVFRILLSCGQVSGDGKILIH